MVLEQLDTICKKNTKNQLSNLYLTLHIKINQNEKKNNK